MRTSEEAKTHYQALLQENEYLGGMNDRLRELIREMIENKYKPSEGELIMLGIYLTDDDQFPYGHIPRRDNDSK